jgi:hypothetical protein
VQEIKELADETERSVSFWIQKAWLIAREKLMDKTEEKLAEKKALNKLYSIRGSLKKFYPHKDSTELSHQAFNKM